MISTHILDTAAGKPAEGIDVRLEFMSGHEWSDVGHGTTNHDGRVDSLTENEVVSGTYRVTFEIAEYQSQRPAFYPHIQIVFQVVDASDHYHIPLLLSPFGYTTYRGS